MNHDNCTTNKLYYYIDGEEIQALLYVCVCIYVQRRVHNINMYVRKQAACRQNISTMKRKPSLLRS